MRAVIIPLNEYFYNYHKYDGMNPVAGFIHRRKWLYNFIRTRFGYILFIVLIVFPLAAIDFLLFIGPIYLYHCILTGKAAAKEKIEIILNKRNRWLEKLVSKNIQSSLEIFQRNEMRIMVYYTKDMIPASAKKRARFFKRLESMKQNLNMTHVFEANRKEDVEDVMRQFDIDPGQSFFMSEGKINLNDYRQLEEQPE